MIYVYLLFFDQDKKSLPEVPGHLAIVLKYPVVKFPHSQINPLVIVNQTYILVNTSDINSKYLPFLVEKCLFIYYYYYIYLTHFTIMICLFFRKMSSIAGRVVVYGGKGALGSTCVSHFKAQNWVRKCELFSFYIFFLFN